jgi:hypothetical protein
METTLRQFLQDLFAKFKDQLIDDGRETIEFSLTENLLPYGGYRLSSSVCPYTLATCEPISGTDKVVDVRAYVKYDMGEVDIAEDNPHILLPFTTVALEDSSTWDWLYQALTSTHPYSSARALKLFSTPKTKD